MNPTAQHFDFKNELLHCFYENKLPIILIEHRSNIYPELGILYSNSTVGIGTRFSKKSTVGIGTRYLKRLKGLDTRCSVLGTLDKNKNFKNL